MDWITFASEAIDSLAWPVVVLIAVVLLREPITKLLPLLRRARYKDLDLEFGEKLGEAVERANEASLPTPGEAPTAEFEDPDDWTFGDYIERLAPISPRAAISEAWRHVELALGDAGRRIGESPRANSISVARRLHETGKLPRDAVSLLADLRSLRNEAVHAREFDLEPEQAFKFARLAERLVASIAVAGAK